MVDLDIELMLDMYRSMLRIRRAEEKLRKLWDSGEIRSLVHLSTGQEAVAVGVCSALGKDDSVVSTHRCHAPYLAKGGDLGKMFAELAGKVGGCCRGRGGSMHLFAPEVGMNLSVPLVGGSIPDAVGIALAAKMKKEFRVSVAFFGDGAVEEGVFWESLNFASVHKLAVIFVCENNLYATHAHILKRQPNENISQRMGGHGVYAALVDGNDVEIVYLKVQELVDRARSGGGPSFLEAKTYRWYEHWGVGDGDWHLGYRTKEEVDFWKTKCPISTLGKKLSKIMGDGFQTRLAEIERSVDVDVEAAVEFAKQSPIPSEEELFQW